MPSLSPQKWDRRLKVVRETDSIKYFRIADLFLFVIPQTQLQLKSQIRFIHIEEKKICLGSLDLLRDVALENVLRVGPVHRPKPQTGVLQGKSRPQ